MQQSVSAAPVHSNVNESSTHTSAQVANAPLLQADSGHVWRTHMFDVLRDEEICWWGMWCGWLVDARTVQMFELGLSSTETLIFWNYLLVTIVVFVFAPPLGIISAIAGFGFIAYRRALHRSNIRSRYSIPGTVVGDCVQHCFCSCCVICQEAREAKLAGLPQIDFCCGEPLGAQLPAHERAIGRSEDAAAVNVADGGNIFSHLQTVSKTSKFIVMLSAFVFILSIFLLFLTGRGQNILVLLLVFVQPIVILYFVYWRSRRQHALLDFVIKSFAVGFWFTTTQSMILELLLQFIIVIVLSPFLGISAFLGNNGTSTDPSDPSPPPGPPGGSDPNTLVKSLIAVAFGKSYSAIGMPHVEANPIPSGSYEIMLQSHSSFPTYAPTLAPLNDDDKSEMLRDHFAVVVIGLLLMSYVVAAGVEETMKHFIVRCCQYPSPLRDPHTVLVYLMAGALGFATAENIEYVFGTNKSPIPGTSVLVGEIVVLLTRVLLPVHVICSVLQAANLSKVLMGHQRMDLFMILLPAILVHGTFDFVLFLMGAVEVAFDEESIGFEIGTMSLAAVIALGGSYWAYRSFTDVQARFEGGWIRPDDEEDPNGQL